MNDGVQPSPPKLREILDRTEPRGPDGWEESVKHLLDRCPHAIRVREGNGPEDLLSSLVVTFRSMQELLEGQLAEAQEAVKPLKDLLFGGVDRRERGLSEIVAVAVARLRASPHSFEPDLRDNALLQAAEVLAAVPAFLRALDEAGNKEPLQPGNLRRLVLAARAYRATPEAWLYEHDGTVHDAGNSPVLVLTENRWKKVEEPWVEIPLIRAG